MTVKQLNEIGRYEVESESKKGEVYLVDLSNADDCYGCSCHHYNYKVAPKINAGAVKYTQETTCKHMMQALIFIGIKYSKQFFNIEKQ